MASPGSDDSIDLFLIGKTGHGKSSSGNSILGREAFHVSDNTESDTYDVQVGWARRDGRKVKVVDGPGIGDTRMQRGDAVQKMVQDMGQGIVQCPRGFHALLLVLKYGNRFTEEEFGTIEFLKSLFGPAFVKDFCILVFTHGELFDINNKKRNPPISFEDWRREQKGAINDLFNECDNRAVLFYNSDEEKMEDQLKILLGIVDGLKSRGKRYTNEAFDKAAKGREELIVRENAPKLREEIQAKIDILVDGLNSLRQCSELDPVTKERFDQLKKDARELEVEIAEQDKGTGVLQQLNQVVKSIITNINSHMEVMKAKLDKSEKERKMRLVQEQYTMNLRHLENEQRERKQGWGAFFIDIFKSIASAFVAPAVTFAAKKILQWFRK
ncbi:GTPase IMAP family member 7 [Aplysia californica]|uniref:GTPase IMAP family member 7 n=1 Tax=Aplysia californica TaxID=6500 RepID=A0ABM0K815_APLCA|nr:GTPase IMAP family member 7 [Aplysia californica]